MAAPHFPLGDKLPALDRLGVVVAVALLLWRMGVVEGQVATLAGEVHALQVVVAVLSQRLPPPHTH